MKFDFIREQMLIFAESLSWDDFHGESLLGFAMLDQPNLTVAPSANLADGQVLL